MSKKVIIKCPQCGGTGNVAVGWACEWCNGTGKMKAETDED